MQLHQAQVATVGADKAYHQKEFVDSCRQRRIAPHAACMENRNVTGLDGRTTNAPGYQKSQRIRKRVEEIWLEEDGGWLAADPLPGNRADAGLGLLRG